MQKPGNGSRSLQASGIRQSIEAPDLCESSSPANPQATATASPRKSQSQTLATTQRLNRKSIVS